MKCVTKEVSMLRKCQLWKNVSSVSKVKKETPRLYISNITEILVKCNEYELYIGEYSIFCKKIYFGHARPFNKSTNILKEIGDIIAKNRKKFWLELPEKNVLL